MEIFIKSQPNVRGQVCGVGVQTEEEKEQEKKSQALAYIGFSDKSLGISKSHNLSGFSTNQPLTSKNGIYSIYHQKHQINQLKPN